MAQRPEVMYEFPDKTKNWNTSMYGFSGGKPQTAMYGFPNQTVNFMQNALDNIIATVALNRGSTRFPTFTRFGSISGARSGFTLGLDNLMYSIPNSAAPVGRLNPYNKLSETFGANAGNRIGGVLHPNGKIYAVGGTVTTILEINYQNKTISTFGSISTGYYCPVVGQDGKIYANNGTNILVVDVVSRQTATFGTMPGGALGYGMCPHPNGMIYSISSAASATAGAEINPINRTVTAFGGITTTGTQTIGLAIASDGNMYAMPYNGTQCIQIEPSQRLMSQFGSIALNGNRCFGTFLAPDGCVYNVPHTNVSLVSGLQINPFAKTLNTFGTNLASNNKWIGGGMHPIGKAYCFPNGVTDYLEIDFSFLTNFDTDTLQSPLLNKF